MIRATRARNKAVRLCRRAGCPHRPVPGDVYCRNHKPHPPSYDTLHPPSCRVQSARQLASERDRE